MSYLHVVILTWKIEADTAERRAILDKMNSEGLALLRAQPGLLLYRNAESGSRTTITASEWESEEHARSGTRRFHEWTESAGLEPYIESRVSHDGTIVVSS